MSNIKMSYYELLESMSMGTEFENGEYICTDGIVIIDGEFGEDIDFVEFRL